MKTTLKRMISLTMVLAIVLTMAFPAFAAGTITPNTGTQVVYRGAKTGSTTIGISLASGSKSFTIKRADVKVAPGSTGGKLTGFYKSNSTYVDCECDSSSGKWTTSTSNSWSYRAQLTVSKPGVATVSYKIGTKTYKTKAKVLAYTNPAKTVVLTGVNSGKNMASLLASSNSAKQMTLKAKTTGAKLTVKPATGWVITGADIYDSTSGVSRSISNWNDGFSTVSLPCGTLLPTHSYYVDLDFRNKSTGASLYCSYYVKGAKAQY
ncbi:MAG: hypothetical protein Q4D81_04470 [Eubacteriales bacterium]|nr:hypothetical protein [Eubacteriales bacterium]